MNVTYRKRFSRHLSRWSLGVFMDWANPGHSFGPARFEPGLELNPFNIWPEFE